MPSEFDYGSLPEQEQQEFLYDIMGFVDDAKDEEAHQWFWDIMYNDDLSYGERMEKYQELGTYLYDEYGIIFDDIWDWEAFKTWYDAQ